MHIRFAYWVPNVSGGLAVSKIPQRTDWIFDCNANIAQTTQARFIASYDAGSHQENQTYCCGEFGTLASRCSR